MAFQGGILEPVVITGAAEGFQAVVMPMRLDGIERATPRTEEVDHG